ncbi:hypothetical protein BDN72DRAFT_469582 [Pluteus cervinus]|uniref:Uncharacterized protein n=1 Tax=Pluteus cervinus TaxID=181527 RepID=A0ACD3B000_9AGAR|nr:hypothetical protein BDN72DRAFT_469582 [Pluteus cervinus]
MYSIPPISHSIPAFSLRFVYLFYHPIPFFIFLCRYPFWVPCNDTATPVDLILLPSCYLLYRLFESRTSNEYQPT